MPPEQRGRAFILEAAARLFSQKGLTGVSIRDIAHACGLTNAALYYHFKNKDDLFLAVMCHNHEKVMAALGEPPGPGSDFRERLKQLVLRYGEVMCRQRQSYQTVRRDIAQLGDARAGRLFGEMRADFLRPIRRLIESGQTEGQIAAGDANLMARLLSGLIIAMTFEGKPGRQPRVTPDEADAVVHVFLDGVGT
jgi:AcrR family transcriptional regulator